MRKLWVGGLAVVIVALAGFAPNPKPKTEIAVFSGGCFWGVQAVFEHVRGVLEAESGYTGGPANTAHYERVSEGDTGNAESVRVVFDPSQVSYDQLLAVFFTVAHDPTQLNRQGPDVGTQYRSAIWYTTPAQEKAAERYISFLTRSKTYHDPIVTTVKPLNGFVAAEAYHQDYFVRHPTSPYIVINDVPKVKALQRLYPTLWRDPPVLMASK
ncbi:MAG TPA: peptide-methionine (S)-S-oxide reductase MsrA [Gemmatimonadales bacterium]|nr:peptide-methionine (S)-S-oxide reductase MsrA [Gemmatimonadales bacterium]